ncbi:MAG: aminotransferase class III-fold pyridoxal phosphate-dependent enzyme, partial [Pseudomonadota bacterium]
CALKLARLYGHQQGIERPAVVVMEGAFHGRTLATISASAGYKIQAGFEPLVEGFVRVPYGNVEAIEKIAQENSSIVAILVEPVQGEGGIILPPAGYLSALRKLCDEKNWLLIFDEIQTGNGRTGNYFAFQSETIFPDILTTAKGLGNGFPIGACLAKGIAATLFKPGNHGTTFGGNPLACRVGRAVIETLFEDNVISNARLMGDYFLAGLKRELSSIPGVVQIRGRGLMLGIELNHPCAHLMKDALAEQLLINVTAEKVIRLLPPLIIQPDHIDAAILKIKKLVAHSCAHHSEK